jgi:hypothetical protein
MGNSIYEKSLLALASVVLSNNIYGFERPMRFKKPKLSKDEINLKLAKNRNLKEFIYGENKLFALNKKSADRKAKNNGWI